MPSDLLLRPGESAGVRRDYEAVVTQIVTQIGATVG